jgi:Lon protease-like protein
VAVIAGNRRYETPADLPDRIPVFPRPGALLLSNGEMPLNIFEPRYIAMVDAALAGDELIGMIQPALDAKDLAERPALCGVGCSALLSLFISYAHRLRRLCPSSRNSVP